MSNLESLAYFKPEIILLAGAFVTLFSDFFIKNKRGIGILALLLLAATGLLIKTPAQAYPLFQGFFVLDSLTHFFRIAALGMTAVAVLLSLGYRKIPVNYTGEYYALLLFMGFALILMSAANHLLMIFLAIEFVSLISYLLTGFLKKDARSKEASLKYLLFGSLASGIMLYGISLIFGATGSLELDIIRTKITSAGPSPLFMTAIVMVLAGIGFKISMAPFHMWAPDIYEGAPTPFTALLTVAPKALGFAVLIRLFGTSFMDLMESWTPIILILSILTMTVGNLTAIAQTNIKRLLAYSSIAQAGYLLMGIAVFSESGLHAVLFYLVAYAFTNLGAFTVVVAVAEESETDDIDAYTGLSKRSPLMAASMTVFLLSLGGIPPLAGFVGKFLVFASAVQAGYFMLVIAAVINSAIAAFYYFKIVRAMYLAPSENMRPLTLQAPLQISLLLMLLGTVLLGVFPVPLLSLASKVYFPF